MVLEREHQFLTASSLQEEFPVPSLDEWRALVEKQLQGAAFEKKLVTKTPEGVAVKPLYTGEDAREQSGFPGLEPFVRGFRPLPNFLTGWNVCQVISEADPRRFATAVNDELRAGSNALRIVFDRAAHAGKDPHEAADLVGDGGVSIFCREDLRSILEAVPSNVELVLEAGEATSSLLLWLESCNVRGPVTLVFDPLAMALTRGALRTEPAQLLKQLFEILGNGGASRVSNAMGIDGRAYGNAGASAVEELAFSFASLIEYKRALPSIGPRDFFGQVSFHLSVGPRLFIEIAKFRAARLLWAQLLHCYEIDSDKPVPLPKIHASSESWSKTTVDPYVNMLRVTTEAFAAAVGGAESITTAPFDCAIGAPDELARRISRNTQLVLLEESHLHRVIDAAGGAWYVESLTNEFAEKSWKLLQQVESMGGMEAAVRSGWVQEKVAATQKERLQEIAQRRHVMVGVNQYADAEEKPLSRDCAAEFAQFRKDRVEQSLKASAVSAPAEAFSSKSRPTDAVRELSIGKLTSYILGSAKDAYTISPLPIRRAAEDYELLRTRTRDFEARRGARPSVLLVGFGPLAQYKPRADFSREFLEPGGYRIDLFAATADPVTAAQNAAEKSPNLVVLCSTDETYPALVPAFCAEYRRLKSDGLVVLAGYPTEHIEAFKAAGVDDFIHLRANNLDSLTRFHQALGA